MYKKSKHELDFIFAEFYKISIIEVISENNYKSHASLNMAIKDFYDKINRAIVLSKFNVEKIDDIIYYPLYIVNSPSPHFPKKQPHNKKHQQSCESIRKILLLKNRFQTRLFF